MQEASVHYQKKTEKIRFLEDESLRAFYDECKTQFLLPDDPSNFVFYTTTLREINNSAIGHADDFKSVHIIRRADYSLLHEFLQRHFPSLRFEALTIQSSYLNILNRIHSIHQAMTTMTKEAVDCMYSVISQIEIPPKVDIPFIQRALIPWFSDFFVPLHDPVCRLCGSETFFVGSQPPTQSEISIGYNSAEKFQCSSCCAITRLLRSRNLQYLISNPIGKADEASLLFALAIKSLKLDVRIVINLDTNHSWVEFYSNLHKRFVHVDPMEKLIDQPLVYELAWGHPHSRVVAIGEFECKDVTRRYTANNQNEFTNLYQRKYLLDLLNLRNLMWQNLAIDSTLRKLNDEQSNDEAKMGERSENYPQNIPPFCSGWQ